MTIAAAHVLVIDDAAELRELFRDILEDAGYRVSLLAVAPCIGDVAQLRPDLILLDLLLGNNEEAAWRLVQQVRAPPPLATVPVVVCSAATHLLRQLEAPLRDLGVEFVPKPFDLEDFLRTIARCVPHHPGGAGHGAKADP